MVSSTQRRALGQYFTPQIVVSAAFSMLDAISGRKPKDKVCVIDPACGDGAFLRYAVGHGIASQQTAIGVEWDTQFRPETDKCHRSKPQEFHLINQNGLLPFSNEE